MTAAEPRETPRDDGGWPSPRIVAAIGGSIIVIAGLVGAVLLFTGDSGSPKASSSSEQSKYSLALYAVEFPSSWVLTRDDEETGIYLESIWRDPAQPNTSILIEAEVPAPKTPISNAESVRARVRRSSGYRELALEPISLAGRPAARWVFNLPDRRLVSYFLNQCEVGITVRGSTSPANFDSLAKTSREVASSATARC